MKSVSWKGNQAYSGDTQVGGVHADHTIWGTAWRIYVCAESGIKCLKHKFRFTHTEVNALYYDCDSAKRAFESGVNPASCGNSNCECPAKCELVL